MAVELSGIGVVLAHVIHGDVAGAEPVDNREHVVAVEANTTLLSSNSFQPKIWMRFMSRRPSRSGYVDE
ncbi:hypothetical protein ASC97_24460 [Rhizobium sp. Root1203]|nr:hypothetical protein ASC97_24460 [Rhizobium sp. Root1203]